MTTATKGRQISVRIASDVDAWLSRRSGGDQHKAGFVRRLIEKARDSEREQELLQMFNHAAAEVTTDDLEERESLLVAFTGRSE